MAKFVIQFTVAYQDARFMDDPSPTERKFVFGNYPSAKVAWDCANQLSDAMALEIVKAALANDYVYSLQEASYTVIQTRS